MGNTVKARATRTPSVPRLAAESGTGVGKAWTWGGTFTEKAVGKIPPQAGKVRLTDPEKPGLILRCIGDTKTWCFRARQGGQLHEVTIGRAPLLSVEVAWTRCRAIAADPKAAADERAGRLRAVTLRDRWEAREAGGWWRTDGKRKLRENTIETYRLVWAILDPRMGGRLVEDITGDEVQALVQRVAAKHGNARARQGAQLVSVLVGGRLPRKNDGRAVGLPEMNPRTRVLDDDEVAALLAGLALEPTCWRVFWTAGLLAPLRRSNLAQTRWAEVDLSRPGAETWTIPAERAKAGKEMVLPIVRPLADLLRVWRQENATDWLFPNSMAAGNARQDGPVRAVPNAWDRALRHAYAVRLLRLICEKTGEDVRARLMRHGETIATEREAGMARESRTRGTGGPIRRALAMLEAEAKRLGIDPAAARMARATPHDLRRTSASWNASAGANLALVAASLGHAPGSAVTLRHYAHAEQTAVRGMLEGFATRALGHEGQA
jgi:integrase